jgi:hypothetical protein
VCVRKRETITRRDDQPVDKSQSSLVSIQLLNWFEIQARVRIVRIVNRSINDQVGEESLLRIGHDNEVDVRYVVVGKKQMEVSFVDYLMKVWNRIGVNECINRSMNE